MSLAKNFKELEKGLVEVVDKDGKIALQLWDDSILGYFWWRFERHEISLCECLSLIGNFVDCGCSRFDCEKVFNLLGDLKFGNQKEKVESSAKMLFSPLLELAKEQWEVIQSYKGDTHSNSLK